MVRLTDGDAIQEEGAGIAKLLQRGERVALRCGAQVDPNQLVAATVQALNGSTVVASVPAALDQVSRTILELVSSLEPADAIHVIEPLHKEPRPLATQEVLGRLEQALDGRCVIIERGENLTALRDDEIASALWEEREHLAKWIRRRANLVTTSEMPMGWNGQVWSAKVPRTSPVVLHNGSVRSPAVLWDEGMDVRTFTLKVALEALGEDPAPDDDTGFVGVGADSLRTRLWSALPPGVRILLRMLAVHARPMRTSMLSGADAGQVEAFERGTSLALWRIRSGFAEVDPGWSAWCVRARASEVLAAHRALAENFASEVQPDDPSAHLLGLSVLEAHRHLLAVDDTERAFHYAHYGAEMLIDHARALSRARHFEESSALYRQILTQGDRLVPRLRGYVKHYLHFNRAHVEPRDAREPVVETAHGYESALKDWPENAIFWSRTIRAWYLAKDATRAQECLARARQQVPDHRDKYTRLIARTGRQLAELGLVIEALEVWGDYQPDTRRATEEQERFHELLRAGWSTDQIVVTNDEPLFLKRRENFKIVAQQGGFRLVAERLGRSALYDTPLACVRAFLRDLSNEVRGLVRALDRELDDEQRERKRVLLGMVDVSASRLDAEAHSTTWVVGRLERDDSGALWLVATGNLSARYEVASDVALELLVTNHEYLGEVDAGPGGVPRGPVRTLEKIPRRDSETIWRMWRERLSS